MPFAFFATAAVFLFEKYWQKKERARDLTLAWFIAAVFAAFLFRYVGMLISVSAVIYAWRIKKDTKPILPVNSLK